LETHRKHKGVDLITNFLSAQGLTLESGQKERIQEIVRLSWGFPFFLQFLQHLGALFDYGLHQGMDHLELLVEIPPELGAMKNPIGRQERIDHAFE